jgi:hypothetical protein
MKPAMLLKLLTDRHVLYEQKIYTADKKKTAETFEVLFLC